MFERGHCQISGGRLVICRHDVGLFQVSVQSGAAHAEKAGNLSDGVFAGVVEALGVLDLLGGEF